MCVNIQYPLLFLSRILTCLQISLLYCCVLESFFAMLIRGPLLSHLALIYQFSHSFLFTMVFQSIS